MDLSPPDPVPVQPGRCDLCHFYSAIRYTSQQQPEKGLLCPECNERVKYPVSNGPVREWVWWVAALGFLLLSLGLGLVILGLSR